MMANKNIGYIMLVVGILITAFSYKGIRSMIGLGLPSAINENIILVIGVIIVLAGAYIGFGGKTSHHQHDEVPIYEGEGKHRRIVGYKRMKK